MSDLGAQAKSALRDMIRAIVREEVAAALREQFLEMVTDPHMLEPDPDKLAPLAILPQWKTTLTAGKIEQVAGLFLGGKRYVDISKETGLTSNQINVALSHRLTPNERAAAISRNKSAARAGQRSGN